MIIGLDVGLHMRRSRFADVGVLAGEIRGVRRQMLHHAVALISVMSETD